jgi:hypothetical protein
LLPFASLSDWKDLAVQHLKSRFNGNNIEDWLLRDWLWLLCKLTLYAKV